MVGARGGLGSSRAACAAVAGRGLLVAGPAAAGRTALGFSAFAVARLDGVGGGTELTALVTVA